MLGGAYCLRNYIRGGGERRMGEEVVLNRVVWRKERWRREGWWTNKYENSHLEHKGMEGIHFLLPLER
jgi:hypothetical protein